MEPCAICDQQPHPADEDHRYLTWAELEAWHVREDARHSVIGAAEATYVDSYQPR